MMPATLRGRGALLALSLLVSACSYFGKDADSARDKSNLTGPLIDAAATAKAQNDIVAAVTYYRSALAREPGNQQAAIGLMQSLRMGGGLDEARAVVATVLAGNPTDPAVLAEAGKVKLATGQLDDAIKLLRQATAADGKDATSLAALGIAYDRLGEYARADEFYEAALAISPRDAYVLNNYALSRVMAHDLGDALALLQRAAAAPNADLRVRQNLALVHALSGDMTAAEEETRRDLPPGQVADALQYYRQFAAALPQAPVAPPANDPPAAAPVSRVAALATDNLVTATPRIEPAEVPPAESARLRPPPRAARSTVDRFAVQIGSYRTATPARHAATGFAAGGVIAKLSRRRGRDGRPWYVVVTADLPRRDEAERVLGLVRSMGAVHPMLLRHRVPEPVLAALRLPPS
jgi:Flp pilus assembly protein TadD